MNRWEKLWLDIRRDACHFWTGGKHNLRDEGLLLRCRICDYWIAKPEPLPPPPPVPDPPVPDEPDDPPAPPVDPAGEPNPATPGAYRAGFLWKPVSESDGKLVCLSPQAYTGRIRHTYLVQPNGVREDGVGVGVYNGGRWHTRFRHVGGFYLPNTEFRLLTDAGRVWSWKVVKTNQRNDGNVTPTVQVPE